MSVQDPLAKILSLYCNVNAFDINQLSQNLRQKRISETEASTFQKQLAEAITHHTLTPTEYKKITGDNEYNTPEELEAWLKELWDKLYSNEPIAESISKK
jgi:hypothetical protein